MYHEFHRAVEQTMQRRNARGIHTQFHLRSNSQPNVDRVTSANSVSGTIKLAGDLPFVPSHVEIVGPAANVRTFRRNTGAATIDY